MCYCLAKQRKYKFGQLNVCQICLSYQYSPHVTVLAVLPDRRTAEKWSLSSISLYVTEEPKPKLFEGDHKQSLHNYCKGKYSSNSMLIAELNMLLLSTSKSHHLYLNCHLNISLFWHSCEFQGCSDHEAWSSLFNALDILVSLWCIVGFAGRKYTCLFGNSVYLIQVGHSGAWWERKGETGDDRKRAKGQNKQAS